MYGQLTTAQLRDQVRRVIGQVPPIDSGAGVAGAQPVRFKFPSNALLNNLIHEGYAWVSRKTRAGGDTVPLSFAVTAQTATGPYKMDLGLVAPAGSVNEVKRAAWLTSATAPEYVLVPADRDQMDRDRIAWATQEPATPQRYWIEEGFLMLWPAPSAAGTLTLMFDRELGWQDTLADNYVLTVLPSEHFPTLVAYIGWRVCLTQPDDMVLADLAKGFTFLINDGGPDMEAFFQRRSRSFQANLQSDVGRVPYFGVGGRR